MTNGSRNKGRARKSGAKQPKGALSRDDQALWDAYVENVDPIRADELVFEREGAGQSKVPIKREPDGKPQQRRGDRARALPSATKVPAPPRDIPRPEPTQSEPKQLDARVARRLGAGNETIDARIDLHGMRQGEAHMALRTFVHRSVARGCRIVLVITGKGGDVLNPDQNAYSPYVHEGLSARGVLRRMVPLWLSEPELRQSVVGFTTARSRHGGEGALYVQLRRRGSYKNKKG